MLKLLMVLFAVVLFSLWSEKAAVERAKKQLINTGNKATKSTRMDSWCFLAVLVMSFFAALRTEYNDTWAYKHRFIQAENLSELLDSGELTFVGNPLYYLFQSFIRQITDNYHVFFLIVAIFTFILISLFFKKYSTRFSYSMYFLITMGTYVFLITAMKQAMAMAVLTIAIDKLLQKKYVAFYLFLIIASGFHLYALVFAVLPLFLSKPWNGRTYLLLIVMLVVMFSFEGVLTSFIETADDMGKSVAEEEIFDNNSMNFFRVLVYAVVPVISFIFRKDIFSNSSVEENLFINMSIISFCVISLGLVNAANMFARVATYFEMGTIVALPMIVDKAFEKETAKTVMVVACVCYFLYFIYEFAIAKSFSTSYISISLFEFINELVVS